LVYEIALTASQYQLPFSLYAEPAAQACAEAPMIEVAAIAAVVKRPLMTVIGINMIPVVK
jgi:hypothetical protein